MNDLGLRTVLDGLDTCKTLFAENLRCVGSLTCEDLEQGSDNFCPRDQDAVVAACF